MKCVLFPLLCVLTATAVSCASVYDFPAAEEAKQMTVVLDVAGEKDDLFSGVNLWAVRTFQSVESDIRLSDRRAGVIMGHYLVHGGVDFSRGEKTDTRGYANVSVSAEDNRVTLDFQIEGFVPSAKTPNLYIRAPGAGNGTGTKFKKMDEIRREWERMSEDLRAWAERLNHVAF